MSRQIVKVYKFNHGDDYEWLLPVNSDDYEHLRFDGQPQASKWKPVKMERMKFSEERGPLKPCDFPTCSGDHMLIINRTAKERIGAKLERYGELLPLACGEGEFWALNVTRIVDALNESRSKVFRGSESGRVLMIDHHVFIPEKLGGAEIFKIPQLLCSAIYVTTPFVDLVQGSGLTGLGFRQVWAPN